MSAFDEVIIRMRTIGAASAAGEVGVAEKGVAGLGRTAKQFAGVAGVGALAFGIKDVTQAAITFQQQQNQLSQALRNTGQYSTQNLRQLVEYSDRLSTHGGLDPSSTLSGIQRLVAAHDSVTRAMSDETLAQDVYRAGQTSYTSALRAIMNVEQGRTTGLSRLGVQIQPVKTAEEALAKARLSHADALKTLTAEGVKMNAAQRAQYELNNQITPQMVAQAKAQDVQATKTEALRVLWHRFNGQVAAFSKGPQGAISNFQHSIDVLAQRLGSVLLPALYALVGGLSAIAGAAVTVVDFFQKNKTAAEILKGTLVTVIGTLAAFRLAAIASAAAEGIMAFASDALAFAMYGAVPATGAFIGALTILDAIPIVAAVAAIIAVIYLLATHFKETKAVALDAWHWIEQAGRDAWTWIKGHWPLLAGILLAPFTGGVSVIVGIFHNQIWGAMRDVWHWLQGAWQTLKHAIEAPFKAAFAAIKWTYDHTIAPIMRAAEWFANLFAGGSAPSWHLSHQSAPAIVHGAAMASGPATVSGLPLVSGPSIVGGRQSGGPIYRSGLYLVGERRPEVVQLPAGAYVHPNAREFGGVPRDGHPLQATIELDGRAFARAVTRAYAVQQASS